MLTSTAAGFYLYLWNSEIAPSGQGLPTEAQTQVFKAALLIYPCICKCCPVTKHLVNLLSLGSACSLRVIINYSALSSTSRQLGGLKDIRKHTIGINAPHYNNTSLMSVLFFYCDGYSRTRPVCSLIHYNWQMLLTVFNLTVLHADINL